MRARIVALLVLPGLALVAPGCVLKRTPEARFFVLRSLAEPPPTPPAGAPAALVGVLPVRMPGYIDRPQLVTWTAPGELRIDEFLRWAEPLDLGITRTVAENLDTLLPESHVVRSPWAAKADLRCRVWLQLDLFGPQAGGEVRLEGRWAILPGREAKPLATKAFDLRLGPLAGDAKGPADASAGVDAMSELLADVSREIAAAVRALPPEAGGEGR